MTMDTKRDWTRTARARWLWQVAVPRHHAGRSGGHNEGGLASTVDIG